MRNNAPFLNNQKTYRPRYFVNQPIFEYLKAQAPTEEYNGLKAKAAKTLFKAISKSVEKDSDIKWNFTKFLISKDGETIKRFAPTTEPKEFEKDIEEML